PQMGGGGAKDQRDLRFALFGDRAAFERVAEVLRSNLPSAEGVVLSGETLYRADPGILRALLREAGWGDASIKTVAIVRDPAGWLNSRYAFETIQFLHGDGFEPYVKRALKSGAALWTRSFGPWIAASDMAFSAIPLRSSDGEPVVRRTLRAMGLSCHGDSAAPRLNEAFDPRTVEAARRLAPYPIAKQPRKAARQVRRHLLSVAQAEGFGGRFQGLDANLSHRIEKASRDDLDAFAAAVWGNRWDDVHGAGARKVLESNEWLRHKGTREEAAAIDRIVASVRQLPAVRHMEKRRPWWPLWSQRRREL
ncbi:MAG: hypothetical protein AAGB11_19160, partial [Pseudomonadota bacterium]